MEANIPVLIVSTHGRGHWLAAELKRENIPTILMDMTSKLGLWPPEDLAGPFGFLKTDDLTPTQLERVFCEDPLEAQDQGFTLWPPSGPVELKSSLTEYRLQRLGQNRVISESFLKSAPDPKLAFQQKWASEHFKSTWILHLAHQWASTTYSGNARASLQGRALPLRSPFFIRKATRPGFQRAVDWLRKQEVEVLQETEILDLSFKNKNTLSGVELHGQKSGILHVDQVVWMLTSEESHYVNPKVARVFFPDGELEPEWSWVRYRLKMSPCPEREALPLHVLILKQITSPWTHENLLCLQRTASEEQFDAWIRIPAVQRFNKEYLRIRAEKVLEILRERLPLALPEIQTFPQEFYYTYSQLGPSTYPVFASGHESRRQRQVFGNLTFDSPETWKNYSWQEQMDGQARILAHLMQWWKVLQQRKEKERDRTLHPS